jgi:hypothetical protein
VNTVPPCCRRLPRLQDRLALGCRGLRVSPCCLGIAGSPATVGAAFDAGINFFFVTADMHWPLYEATRRGLQALFARRPSVRDEVVVAGVCYPTQPEFCSMPFAELVEAIPGLGRLDVLIAGGATARDFEARLPVYREHRRQGFQGARAIGASFHDRAVAQATIQQAGLDLALVRYNPGHAGARRDIFPHLPERPRPLLFGFKSTFGYVPPSRMTEFGLPARTHWHPAITDHYRFALTPPEMDGLLIALKSPSEVAALAAALAQGPLSEEEERYLMDVAGVARGEARVVPEH